jgi:hypothetical protein
LLLPEANITIDKYKDRDRPARIFSASLEQVTRTNHIMEKRNIYSLCEAHFESFKERCLDYNGDPALKPRECQGTYDFVSECVGVATLSCCEKEASEFRAACDEAQDGAEGARPWEKTQTCRASTGRLVRCMTGTYGIKERIDLQSAEDRDLDRRARELEAEAARTDAIQQRNHNLRS